MDNTRKDEKLAEWRGLLENSESIACEGERYDELLKRADILEQDGIISSAEWRQLVREAAAIFDRRIVSLEDTNQY
jgi:hypothetical protein